MQIRDVSNTLSALVFFSASLALGCGGGKAAEPASASAPAAEAKLAEPPPATAAPAPAAEVTVQPDAAGVVHLTGNDQMRYSASRIEVKAGQKVKVEMKNAGALPKEAMGHDFVVLKAGSDPMAFGAKAATAKATDYIPADAGEMIAHTKLLGPGEADTIEFDLPGAGTYPYLCTFPGHVAIMKGVIVAQ